jgi:molybdate transport system substrate-binding protein
MRTLLWGFLMTITLSTCQYEEAPEKLTIAVAANVQFAIAELEKAFEAMHNIPVEVVLSSSGKLTAQIQQGAPYDLFLSANMKYPRYLQAQGLAASPPEVYATGSLVAWTTKNISLDSALQILTRPSIRKIAIANPKNAPYGEAAQQLLQKRQLWDVVSPKLVFGESITQTNQYILSGASDMGFTAKSVVLSPAGKGQSNWIELPISDYAPIDQGVVLTRHGQQAHPVEARQFIAFLKTPAAKAIFEKYGYRISNTDK